MALSTYRKMTDDEQVELNAFWINLENRIPHAEMIFGSTTKQIRADRLENERIRVLAAWRRFVKRLGLPTDIRYGYGYWGYPAE